MRRDPLDELIEDLERIVPAKAPEPVFDTMKFQEMSVRLDRLPAPGVAGGRGGSAATARGACFGDLPSARGLAAQACAETGPLGALGLFRPERLGRHRGLIVKPAPASEDGRTDRTLTWYVLYGYYTWSMCGRYQVAGSGKFQRMAVWSRSGRGTHRSSSIGTGTGCMVSRSRAVRRSSTTAPVPLFERAHVPGIFSQGYDVTPDGQFLIVTRREQATVSQLDVVLNWDQELLERVPVP